MSRILRVTFALVMIVGAGIVHGGWTSRWRPAPALREMAARLQELPMTMPGWAATARTMPSREQAASGAVGYISRIYQNANKGLNFSVLLLTGLPGDIGTHTPEACYPGAGFALGPPEKVVFRYGPDQAPAEFRTAVARKEGVNPSVLRIYWSWRGSKGWSAPDDARWEFGSQPTLTKLYVVQETSGQTVDPKDDPSNEFISRLLADMEGTIFSAASQPPASSPVASTSSQR